MLSAYLPLYFILKIYLKLVIETTFFNHLIFLGTCVCFFNELLKNAVSYHFRPLLSETGNLAENY